MVKASAEGADRSEGGGIGKAGWYMFVVDAAEESDVNAKLECSVVSGDHEEEKGHKLTHFVNFFGSDPSKQKTVNRMMFDWAEAMGLVEKTTGKVFTPELREQLVNSAAEVEFDFGEATGHAFVAKVDLEPYKGNDPEKKAKYEGRMFPRIAFDVYHPLHDKVKDVPKDPDIMGMYGGGSDGGGNGSPAKPDPAPTAPQTATAAPAQSQAPANDPWAVF